MTLDPADRAALTALAIGALCVVLVALIVALAGGC